MALTITDEEKLKKLEKQFVLSNFKYDSNDRTLYNNLNVDVFKNISRKLYQDKNLEIFGEPTVIYVLSSLLLANE